MGYERDEKADGESDKPQADLYSVRDPYGDAMNMAQNAERMKKTFWTN